jgi:rubrerythrin
MKLVEQQRRTLRWAFRVALLAAATPATLQACGESAGTDPGDGGAGTRADSAARRDAGADAADDVEIDCAALSSVGCNMIPLFDAMSLLEASDVEICPVVLPCGLPSSVKANGCTLVDSLSDAPIGCWVVAGCVDSEIAPGPCGAIGIDCRCDIFAGGGRRLSGSRRSRTSRSPNALGDYFARMAEEEAASVDAFEVLERELAGLCAPRELVHAAGRAREDERRHARTMTRLAARFAATPSRTRPGREPRLDRRAMALENAVEGCVRETFAALLATWQAERASDPSIRRSLERIAADETRHAALAWAIDAWLQPSLDEATKRRVARARRTAVRNLSKQLTKRAPEPLVASAGFPRPAEAQTLLRVLARQLET